MYCGAGCFVVLLFAVGNGDARRFVWRSENRVSAMQRTLWYMIVFGHDSLIERLILSSRDSYRKSMQDV